MANWHVSIGVMFESPIVEDSIFDVVMELDDYGASASVAQNLASSEVLLTIEASSAVDAITAGSRIVTDAFASTGVSATVVEIRSQSSEAFASELATPIFPEVVGYAEIAELAAVSRQRARQFAEIASFPEPVIETAQGPLMTKSAVVRWLENRNTVGGRPRKVSQSA